VRCRMYTRRYSDHAREVGSVTEHLRGTLLHSHFLGHSKSTLHSKSFQIGTQKFHLKSCKINLLYTNILLGCTRCLPAAFSKQNNIQAWSMFVQY
jgi:hypothetical protein